MTAERIAQALGGRRVGNEWRCPCVLADEHAHGDRDPSLYITERDGKVLVRCRSRHAEENDRVIAELQARDLWPSPTPRKPRREAKREVGRQSWRFAYQGGVAIHHRVDFSDGSKTMFWEPKGVRPSELIYAPEGLDHLDTALVVEGEKAADAAAAWEVAAVYGTVCGASSIPTHAALQPIAKRYPTIFLWPDNDAPGQSHMQKIGQRLLELGAKDVRVVDWPDAPSSDDAANFEGGVEQVQALLDAARPFEPNDKRKPERKSDNERESQATQLVNLALGEATLFHYGENVFATLPIRDHVETHDLRSRAFRRWLAGAYFEREQKAPNGDAIRAATETLAGYGQFRSEEREVHVRVAGRDGRLYLDLCDADWRVVEIGPDGWRVIESGECPVRFRRAHGMQALPLPERGGSIDELRPFINTASEADFRLVVAFLVSCYRDRGPYPVLILHGDPGAAKTTVTRVLRDLVDPNSAPVRSEPREPRDLMIAASNGWLIAFDNLSRIPTWLSDALCRMSTGGGFSTRELYTNGDEIIFQAQRPVILTGIREIATRADLLDRALLLYLPRIDESQRMTEATFNEAFSRARPRLLGVMLDAVSCALSRLSSVRVERLPRLADFAVWVEAAAPALGWSPGAFLSVYGENRSDANAITLAASPVAEAVQALSQDFTGTASELLDLLNGRIGDKCHDRTWPKTPWALSNALRDVAANLAAIGIHVAFADKDHKREPGTGRRLIRITYSPVPPPVKAGETASHASQSQQNCGFFCDAAVTQTSPCDAVDAAEDYQDLE
jgi:hypothetical protein